MQGSDDFGQTFINIHMYVYMNSHHHWVSIFICSKITHEESYIHLYRYRHHNMVWGNKMHHIT